MYQPGTILKLREPKSTEDKVFPYDEVEVIGQSPQTHSGMEFAGADQQGVIIRPITSFDRNLDEPLGRLQAMYEPTYVPDNRIEVTVEKRIIDGTTSAAGPTPPKVKPPKKQPSPLS
jgi:hypothetical protein